MKTLRIRILRWMANLARGPVARSCTLLYRRIAFGKGSKNSKRADQLAPGRLQICDTADYKSALRGLALRWTTAAILLLATQSPALAHAFLDHADPKVGSVVAGGLSEIKLWFTQELEPAFSSVEVLDAAGKEVDKKDVHPDPKNKSLLIISVPQLPAGTYKVIWRVVSVDTHKTQGHFEFTVKAQQK